MIRFAFAIRVAQGSDYRARALESRQTVVHQKVGRKKDKPAVAAKLLFNDRPE